ncbi:MAG TPA: peptide-methionine (S)-S-oxide reductase MsrA [Bacteroidales bacterium]|nr:peptide-methionine (S)-S-oxide reductase MsrA [Bacteroidales bacterium]HRZ78198.1 peptide-methionine (S)-S-oxide reductase MsrA [Bacteroidales bacterium]
MRLATFGGGCFWCTEALFQQMKGVVNVASGYSGGRIPSPTYREVCSGLTGHAEVIQLTYDPMKVEYADLLRVFFGTHDPTTLNRQGADVGTQYRSVIFFHDEEQQAVAGAIKAEAQQYLADPIVTEIASYTAFYKAEEGHQDYYNRNRAQGYCQLVIAPKLEKLRRAYGEFLK